jgi:hypothetical protein
MKKDAIAIDAAVNLMDRLGAELGLVTNQTSSFRFLMNPKTKHRLYVQKQRYLRRVDSTLPRVRDDGTQLPGTIDLNAPNGSIRFHVEPTLEMLELHIRWLAECGAELDQSKTKPFSGGKPPSVRKPQPVDDPLPSVPAVPSGSPEPIDPNDLSARLVSLAIRSKEAKVERVLQNPEKYGQLSKEEAEQLVIKEMLNPAHLKLLGITSS